VQDKLSSAGSSSSSPRGLDSRLLHDIPARKDEDRRVHFQRTSEALRPFHTEIDPVCFLR
jgi:hypothetical protein